MEPIYKNIDDLLNVRGNEFNDALKLVDQRRILAGKEEAKPKMKTFGILQKLKDKFLTPEFLLSICTYQLLVSSPNQNIRLHPTISKFFEEHGSEFIKFRGFFHGHDKIREVEGFRVAFVEGVPFVLVTQDETLLTKYQGVVFIPIWLRERALKILSDYGHRKKPIFTLTAFVSKQYPIPSKYDSNLANQEQFISPAVYDHMERYIDRLVDDRTWYEKNGKRHKETFFLHGAPGTGKTSLFMHFAAKKKLPIITTTPEHFVSKIEEIRFRVKENPDRPTMILIEDIDSFQELVQQEYRTATMMISNNSEETPLTYSSFINVLDGSRPLENVLVCLSSNRREVLIPSVIRHGRVDHDIEVIPFTSKEIAERVGGELEQHVASFPNGTFSISHIIDLRYCKSEEEITKLASWLAKDNVQTSI